MRTEMAGSFDAANFHSLCDMLAAKDNDLHAILRAHGYPPLWRRKPNFTTLVHIILEQQVSLASARAALIKLQEKLGRITPAGVISLSDAELKACYFSRQKIRYVRHLAMAIRSKALNLRALEHAPDASIRKALMSIPGIGDWTADVYLMMALHRADCFPTGDIALLKSLIHHKNLPGRASKDAILSVAEAWKPYRTIAAFLLWHAYICRSKKQPI